MQVLFVVANGFEETELVATFDFLKRCGIEVTLAGLGSSVVESRNGLRILADCRLDEVDIKAYDALILPGGDPGYKNLANSARVLDIVREFEKEGKLIAAICAAPYVLAKAGILDDKIATIYPGMEKLIPRPREGRVIRCKNIITARGPGDVFLFAMKIGEVLVGKEKAKVVAKHMLVEEHAE